MSLSLSFQARHPGFPFSGSPQLRITASIDLKLTLILFIWSPRRICKRPFVSDLRGLSSNTRRSDWLFLINDKTNDNVKLWVKKALLK